MQDSCRWVKLFEKIHEINPGLAIQLQGIRGQGTELGWTKLGKPRLVPLIDWNGWANEREYSRSRDNYLKPNIDILGPALNELLDIPKSSLPPGIHEKESPWPGITGANVYVARDGYARERMHLEHPWAWVFNKGEVLEIVGEKDVLGTLNLRGKTGTFFMSEKRKEKWDADSRSRSEGDQGLPEIAKAKSNATNQDFGW